mmetsp:Transcript_4784/g.6216  ORF Transcript_4784/g.6216 Transcript_4784/m.6216 type:complete len:435 (+) Transcript_4784:78-1382(+)
MPTFSSNPTFSNLSNKFGKNKIVKGSGDALNKTGKALNSTGKTIREKAVVPLQNAFGKHERTADDQGREFKQNEKIPKVIAVSKSSPVSLTTTETGSPRSNFVEGTKHAFNGVPGMFKGLGEQLNPFARHVKTSDEIEEGNLPPVPVDETLERMNIIIRKRIKGVTVQQFYETVWSEQDDKPLFEPWLKEGGKMDISVEKWQDGNFKGEWDKESYYKQRLVNFKFTRTTHMYTGPPIASVQHTQNCRLIGDDRCVLAMKVKMEGIPFADCFDVQIRWVVTRLGEKDELSIQVGLFVNFVKQTVLAAKIRSGTTEETTKTQLSLFEAAKMACSNASHGMIPEDIEDDKKDGHGPDCMGIPRWFSELFRPHAKNDVLTMKLDDATNRLRKARNILHLIPENDELHHKVDSELTDVLESLNLIEKQLKLSPLQLPTA